MCEGVQETKKDRKRTLKFYKEEKTKIHIKKEIGMKKEQTVTQQARGKD